MCGCLAFYAFARPTDAAGCIVFWFFCVCVQRGYIRLWPGGSVPRPASGRLLVVITHTHTHTRWASTRKVKPIWILLEQETVSGCGVSWAICKSAPRSRQITMPAPNHCVFYRPDALPAAKPTASSTEGNCYQCVVIFGDTSVCDFALSRHFALFANHALSVFPFSALLVWPPD